VLSVDNLNNGRIDVHNEEGQGRKSIMTEDVNDKFVFKISRFTILDNI